MGLFKNLFGKEEKRGGCCDMKIVEVDEGAAPAAPTCSCGGACGDDALPVVTVMGPGCSKCHKLLSNVETALNDYPKPATVQYVTDTASLANAGITATPALLINGNVVSQGIVLSTNEITGLLLSHVG